MAPVKGRPFLSFLVRNLQAQRVRRIVFCTGYLADTVKRYFGSGSGDLDFLYSEETTPLGTGGAIRQAMTLTSDDPIIVLNGDSYVPFDLRTLVSKHLQRDARVTLWAVSSGDRSASGGIVLDPQGGIAEFKPGLSGPGLVNAGIYAITRRVLERFPARVFSLESDLLAHLVNSGLYAVVGSSSLIDIGTPASYQKAQKYDYDTHPVSD